MKVMIIFFLFGRISFVLDEKGKFVENLFVKRFIVLFSKIIVIVINSVKKYSGGFDRNNYVLMEFYLNKVRSI